MVFCLCSLFNTTTHSFFKKIKLFDSYSYHGKNLNNLMIKYYSYNI